MKLFNRDGHGAEEIENAVGLIAKGISFDVWEPYIPLGIRDVEAIIGPEIVKHLSSNYYDYTNCYDLQASYVPCFECIALLQRAVALFTWLKIIPTLDAQHDVTGRSRRLGENEKGLTALQEYKDEQNIRNLAYETVDALIAALDALSVSYGSVWRTSAVYKRREGLLVKTREAFDNYFHTGSSRLFITLLPMMHEVQQTEVAPVIGADNLKKLLAGTPVAIKTALYDHAARALVLLSMKKAVERLPIEVIPEGIVQINQSQPVNARVKAEQAARESVARSLEADGRRALDRLALAVSSLQAAETREPAYIQRPIVHDKGMSF